MVLARHEASNVETTQGAILSWGGGRDRTIESVLAIQGCELSVLQRTTQSIDIDVSGHVILKH